MSGLSSGALELELGEELDRAILVGRDVDLGPLRPARDAPAAGFLVRCHPIGDAETEADGVLDQRLDRAARLDRDRVTGTDLIGRAVGPAAVDLDVPVRHELAGLRSRAAEAQAVDDVVEALL